MSSADATPTTSTIVLETARLTLSAPRPADAEALYALVGGDRGRAVTRTLCWDGPESLDSYRGWIEETIGKSFEDGIQLWLLRDRTGEVDGAAGAPLGTIALHREPVEGRAHVGYWLGEAYWGRGLMREAVGAVTRYGFEALGLAKIDADVLVHNPRSLALLDRLGFRREGILRRVHQKQGAWVDAVRFGIIPGELTVESDENPVPS